MLIASLFRNFNKYQTGIAILGSIIALSRSISIDVYGCKQICAPIIARNHRNIACPSWYRGRRVGDERDAHSLGVCRQRLPAIGVMHARRRYRVIRARHAMRDLGRRQHGQGRSRQPAGIRRWQATDEADARCMASACRYRLDAGPRRRHRQGVHSPTAARRWCICHTPLFHASASTSIRQSGGSGAWAAT